MTTLLSLFDDARGATAVNANGQDVRVLEFSTISSFLDIQSLLHFGTASKKSRLLARAAGERRVQQFLGQYETIADPEVLHHIRGILGWQRKLRYGTTQPLKKTCIQGIGNVFAGTMLPDGNFVLLVDYRDLIIVSCDDGSILSTLRYNGHANKMKLPASHVQYHAEHLFVFRGGTRLQPHLLQIVKTSHNFQSLQALGGVEPGRLCQVSADCLMDTETPVFYMLQGDKSKFRLTERKVDLFKLQWVDIQHGLTCSSAAIGAMFIVCGNFLLVVACQYKHMEGDGIGIFACSIDRRTMIVQHRDVLEKLPHLDGLAPDNCRRNMDLGLDFIMVEEKDGWYQKVSVNQEDGGVSIQRVARDPGLARSDLVTPTSSFYRNHEKLSMEEYDNSNWKKLRTLGGDGHSHFYDEKRQVIYQFPNKPDPADDGGVDPEPWRPYFSLYSLKSEQHFLGE